jgi:Fis family transcriptional regulator, factor for inversion stimulation protein
MNTTQAVNNLTLVETSAKELSSSAQSQHTIRESVAHAMQNYLSQLEGQDSTGVYDMVLAEVEEPLLQAIMKYTRKNQTRAANMLGLNRGTLRKKLKQYNML